MNNQYIKIKDAAKLLGVTPLTLRNWDKSGKLPAMRHPINNYRVYKIEDIKKIIGDFDTVFEDKKSVINKETYPQVSKKIEVKHIED